MLIVDLKPSKLNRNKILNKKIKFLTFYFYLAPDKHALMDLKIKSRYFDKLLSKYSGPPCSDQPSTMTGTI